MIKFIRDAMSESGTPSIKRVVFIILLIAFLGECCVNIFTGKMLNDTLCQQLYLSFVSCLAAIVGVSVLNGIKDIKITQSQNNKEIGSPSPTPDPTIVTTK